jgi:hypothetical protein
MSLLLGSLGVLVVLRVLIVLCVLVLRVLGGRRLLFLSLSWLHSRRGGGIL